MCVDGNSDYLFFLCKLNEEVANSLFTLGLAVVTDNTVKR